MLGDYQEADDTAQEVFVKVFTSIKKFRFESAFSTWGYPLKAGHPLKSSNFSILIFRSSL
jgi:hypothetical protein